MPVGEYIKELGSAAVAGVLGLLWWDIRSIRKDNEKEKKELAEAFIPRKEHDAGCELNLLRFSNEIKDHMEDRLKEHQETIIKAIKDNNCTER